MFTGTPEKPAWLVSALSIVAGIVLVATGHPVPDVLQGLALAGLVAAVALADAGTSNVFAWGLVVLGLVGVVVLALLNDGLPTWLEAVTGLGVAGGASLSVPTSVPKVTVSNTGNFASPSTQVATKHFVGPSGPS
jgi:hypothetical protein